MYEYSPKTESLSPSDIDSNISLIETTYLRFSSNYKQLEEYKTKLEKCSLNQYNHFQHELNYIKTQITSQMETIRNIKQILETTKTPNQSLKIKITKNLKVINETYIPKEKACSLLLETIERLERNINLRNSIDSNDNSRLTDSRLSQSSYSSERIIDSRIQIKDYKDEFLEERKNIIEQVKVISGQCADLSNAIKLEVHNQGEMVDEIEMNVIGVEENTKKANEEIQEMNELTKKRNQRLKFIFGIILLLVLMIVYMIWKIISKYFK
jgi:predicted nucleic acid-binding Zn ribbon protein